MRAYDQFYALDLKMEKLLADKQLVHDFSKRKKFPLTMTIMPDANLDAQMEMYSQEGSTPSPDAKWIITFKSLDKDGIESLPVERFPIDEDLRSKIMNLAKKMVVYYVFGFFAESIAAKNGDDINYSGSSDADDSEDTGDFDEFYEDEDDQDEENGGAEE